MSVLDQQFDAAVAASKNLDRPDNDTMLKLYALYKQGTVGGVEGRRPGFTDMIGRAKYDAWAAVKGKTTDLARRDYAALVDSLK